MFPILLLSAAGFTVLTTEFIIVGLLPAMARDLQITVSQAGLLVSLFAFTVAAAGPFLTALFNRMPRRQVFVGTLVIFGAANALAALASNIYVMAVARLIPALALPVYWSLASGTAMAIVGPDKAGRALSVITFGIIAATVLGIPIGTLIGDAYGWRSAFGALSVLSFLKALMLYRFLPVTNMSVSAASLSGQVRILKDPVLVMHVALSALVFCGMFTAYTYLADILERLVGLSGAEVGWWLMAFGAVGLMGNFIGGRLVDRDPLITSLFFSALMTAGMLAVAPSVSSHAALITALGGWGIAQAGLFLVSHTRVMKAAPQAAEFAASLNIAGANLGIALGAVIGGHVIERHGLSKLGIAGAAILGLSMLLSFAIMQAQRHSRRRLAQCPA